MRSLHLRDHTGGHRHRATKKSKRITGGSREAEHAAPSLYIHPPPTRFLLPISIASQPTIPSSPSSLASPLQLASSLDHAQFLLLQRALAMASTSSSTTPAAEVEERGRKRKRADGAGSTAAGGAEAQPSKWRTRREHEIYSSKLLEAIRLVRAGSSSSSGSGATRGRAVREAADRALAVAARGRTHWSRAILASRRRRFQAVRRARLRAPATPPSRHNAAAASSSAASATGQGSSAPPLAERARMLGWLVPGCRRLSFPTLLEETTDYIEALQMQVRTMAALAEALSAISANSSSGGAGSSNSSAA
ncbi:hypothetical protein HU200_023007 [Digitaria exilis]|uniref:IBH1-like N-terminal domain-containing protein n=1 Tax=Digitaria exilis TaxID=1010633 RepID=A0A835EX11_9POAL|nr:hypothetical protein HU200_023007 [Digitaria exilis]